MIRLKLRHQFCGAEVSQSVLMPKCLVAEVSDSPRRTPCHLTTANVDPLPVAQPRVKKWVCPFFLLLPTNFQLRRSKASIAQELGEAVPLPSRLLSLGERRKLPQRGLGQSPSRKRFCRVSCAILCDFARHLVHLTAAWNWEIHTALVASRSNIPNIPFNIFGVSDTLNLNFWGCSDTQPLLTASGIIIMSG